MRGKYLERPDSYVIIPVQHSEVVGGGSSNNSHMSSEQFDACQFNKSQIPKMKL